MRVIGLTLEATVESAALEDHLAAVMDQLHDLPGAVDPDITASLATGEVAVVVGVEAEDEFEAFQKGVTLIRTAIHAAGGFAPDQDGWALHDLRRTEEDRGELVA